MLTILIATDHKPLRETLSSLILAQPLFHLVAVCADSHAAMTIAEIENPDIVLIDGSTDPMAVTAATKKIVSGSGAGVIALSRYTDTTFTQHMLSAGALGYVSHAAVPAEIIKAILEVAKDNIYLCKEVPAAQQIIPVHTPAPVAKSRPLSKKFTAIPRQQKRRIIPRIIWHNILRFTN